MAVLIYICSSKVFFLCEDFIYIYIFTESNTHHTKMSAGSGNSVAYVLHANSPWTFAVSIVCVFIPQPFFMFI